MYSHTQKIAIQKNVSVFSTHTKKYYVIHAKKLLVFFTIQKIAIHFFPYKKLLCSARTKNLLCILTHKKILHNTPYKKFSSIFSHTKNYYVLHAHKKLPYKKIAIHFFPYKKLLCSARTKNYHTKKLLAFFPIQKITM